uniref:Uncharacterized protein n=1 Tax=Tanacetum cinerariifolium TaxID=118510 RepID=A0A699GEG7_TANCI|nr:hypothetical protein [Tanacetum cinerariifolium]
MGRYCSNKETYVRYQTRHRRRRQDRSRPAPARDRGQSRLPVDRFGQPQQHRGRHSRLQVDRGHAGENAGSRSRLAVHAAAIPLRCRARRADRRQARVPGKAAGRHAVGSGGPGSAGRVQGPDPVYQLALALRAGRAACQGVPGCQRANRHARDLERGRASMAPEPGMDLAGGRPGRVRSGHQCAVDRHRDPADRHLPQQRQPGIPGQPRSADCCRPALPERGRPARARRIRLAPDRQAKLGHPGGNRQGPGQTGRRRFAPVDRRRRADAGEGSRIPVAVPRVCRPGQGRQVGRRRGAAAPCGRCLYAGQATSGGSGGLRQLAGARVGGHRRQRGRGRLQRVGIRRRPHVAARGRRVAALAIDGAGAHAVDQLIAGEHVARRPEADEVLALDRLAAHFRHLEAGEIVVMVFQQHVGTVARIGAAFELDVAVLGAGAAGDQVVKHVHLAVAVERQARGSAVVPVAGKGHVHTALVAPGAARVAIAHQCGLVVLAKIIAGDGDVIAAAHHVQRAVVAGFVGGAGQRVWCVAVGNRQVRNINVLRARQRDAVRVRIVRVFRVHVPRRIEGNVADDDVAGPGGIVVAVLAVRDPLLEVGLLVAGGRQRQLAADQQRGAGKAGRASLGIVDAHQRGVGRDVDRAAVLLVRIAGVLAEHGVVLAPAQVDMADHADDLGFVAGLVDGGHQLLAVVHRVHAVGPRRAAAGHRHRALARPRMPAVGRRRLALEGQHAAGGIGLGKAPGGQLGRRQVVGRRVQAVDQHRRGIIAYAVLRGLQRGTGADQGGGVDGGVGEVGGGGKHQPGRE